MARSARTGAAAALLGGGQPGWATISAYCDDERLAIYDWLAPEGREARLLADPAALWVEAAIRGDMFEQISSAAPRGLRLRATARPVRFRILCSRELPRRLPILDAWTSACYQRVTAEADYLGLVLRTQLYVLKEAGLY